jgi:EmrB/QacA subfamily drug resistance transporter
MTQAVSKKAILFITTLSSFLTTFMVSSVNIALPTIGKEFSANAIMLSWITSAFLITSAVFLVPMGRIADLYGRKKIFVIGILGYGLTSVLAMVANSAILLAVTRAVQGVAGSMIFSTAVAILTSVFPPGERGKALGINLAATYIGLSLGPFLGGLLTQHLGWRSIFAFNLLFCISIIPLILWKMKQEWAESQGEKFDWQGSILYMAGLSFIMVAFSTLPSMKGSILLILGLILLVFFFYLEKNIKNPVLNLSHFRHNTVFIFSNMAAFINYSATFAVGFLLSLYLQYIQGMNPRDAGLILVSQPVMMALFSPLAGRLSDKIEPRIVASLGMLLCSLGLFSFIFLDAEYSKIYIVLTLVILGIGFALFSSPNTNAIMSSVDKKFYGIASASVGTMRLTGQAISMSIAMMVFSMIIGKITITPDVYPLFIKSIHFAFILFSGLCFLGIFSSLARGKLRRNGDGNLP